MRDRVLPALGAARLGDISRLDVQDLVDRMLVDGLDGSTIRNALMPLRALYRRNVSRGEVVLNPTAGLELPAVLGRRDRVASPAEAVALIAALGEADRPVWATAMYGGLRRGELQALTWDDVDLGADLIHVRRAWDETSRAYIDVKSNAAVRTVPLAAALRAHLVQHRLRTGRTSGLVFGADGQRPFVGSTLWRRAARAWGSAGLKPIGLHEARHTFASLLIAAGVNAKAISTYLGHSSVTLTYDRYGHLLPGSEKDAARQLNTYLALAPLEAPSG